MQHLTEIRNLRASGQSLANIVADWSRRDAAGRPMIAGYFRPKIYRDERVPVLQRLARRVGLPHGPYEELAEELDRLLVARWNSGWNVAGYASAVNLDQGYQPEEIRRLRSLSCISGVSACYADAVEQPPESFLPVRVDDVTYNGPTARPLPAADDVGTM